MERLQPKPVNPSQERGGVEQKAVGYRDIIRYFVAGQLIVKPDIDGNEISANISHEFQVGDQHVSVEGQWPDLSIHFSDEAHGVLQQKFGGEHPGEPQEQRDFRNHPFWENY